MEKLMRKCRGLNIQIISCTQKKEDFDKIIPKLKKPEWIKFPKKRITKKLIIKNRTKKNKLQKLIKYNINRKVYIFEESYSLLRNPFNCN